MSFFLFISRAIDGLSRLIGRCVGWFIFAAIVICVLNAAVLKAFASTSAFQTIMTTLGWGANSFIEIQWYLFSATFLFAAGYTLLCHEHVKIDVIAGRFSKTTQVWIDIFGICVFLLPFVVLIIKLSIPFVWKAYVSQEMSDNAGGLIRWPLYAMLPVGFIFLGLQGISELIKRFAFLAGAIPDPTVKPQGKTAEQELAEFLASQEVAAREAALLGAKK